VDVSYIFIALAITKYIVYVHGIELYIYWIHSTFILYRSLCPLVVQTLYGVGLSIAWPPGNTLF